MNSHLPIAAPEYVVTLLNGPEKGASFKIVSGRISIGRGTDNDIVLSYDSKVSRNHAWITVTPNGVEVADVSDKNKLLVNGQETTKQILGDKSVIQLGETKLQFRISSPDIKLMSAPADFLNAVGSHRAAHTRAQPNFSKNHIIMVAAALILGYFFLSKPSPAPSQLTAIRTEDEVVRDISSIETETAKVQAERASRGANAPNYHEINSHYIRGFRDYRKGNYQRAVESFQACLSLMPNHEKCQKYYNDSTRGFWSLVDAEMLRGLQLKEKHQFTSCVAAFENVKNLVMDQTNKKYMEAEANRKFCSEKARSSF